jgi:hypothetical protein
MSAPPSVTAKLPDPLPIPPKKLASPAPAKSQSPQPATNTKAVKKTNPPQSQPVSRQQSVAVPASYVPPPLEIRVGIARQVAGVVVGTSQQSQLQGRSGQLLKIINQAQPLRIEAQGSSFVIDGNIYPGVLWLTPRPNGFFYVGERWYRGRLLLVAQENQVTAVNYVDLEHYLISVVGSEMHANAPAEALKAQAIAARSYALVHMIRPASQWFDLGDNQRWQVYKGINSEYPSGYDVVAQTAGQVLSHQGGVVESLYASTDAIVSSVHKGRGMSQLGAYDLAKQGYNYQQILNRYYPGVLLARVVLKP